MQRIQRTFGLLAQQGAVGQHVLVQVTDVTRDSWLLVANVLLAANRQVTLFDAFTHQRIKVFIVDQQQPRVTTDLRQFQQQSLLLHPLTEPRQPLTEQRRRKLLGLEMLPQGFFGQGGQKAWSFRQTEHVPETVGELRPKDAVAVWTSPQRIAADITYLSRILNAPLISTRCTQTSREGLEAGFWPDGGKQ